MMDPKWQPTFDAFATTLRQTVHTDVDLLDIISGFALSGQSSIAGAFATTAAEFIRENDDTDLPYTEVILAAYKGTFFDEESAKRFGTEEVAQRGLLGEMTNAILQGCAMDQLAAERGAPIHITEDKSAGGH